MGNNISKQIRMQILSRDKHRCRSCGRGVDDNVKLTVDHIQPRDKGGTDNIDNLQTYCRECNEGKANLILRPVLVPPEKRTGGYIIASIVGSNSVNSVHVGIKNVTATNIEIKTASLSLDTGEIYTFSPRLPLVLRESGLEIRFSGNDFVYKGQKSVNLKIEFSRLGEPEGNRTLEGKFNITDRGGFDTLEEIRGSL